MRDLPRLRNQIVLLEVTDAHHVGMNARRYLAAARAARVTIERELGGLGMKRFAATGLDTLQTTAENIYFESYRCFADLEGSGHAAAVQKLADQVIARARAR